MTAHARAAPPAESSSVLHSWCIQTEWQAPTVTGGQGARLFTADGRSILDMSSLAECSNLGHQHPRVVAAIRAQAQRLCFVTSAWGAEPRAQLAALLLERAACSGGRVFFTLGGADANEHAVKFARQASARPDGWIITRERSYHGASYAAMALSGDTRTRQIDPATFHVLHVPPPYPYRCPFGTSSAAACGTAAAAHIAGLIGARGAAQVAAVLMEPNAGTNGIVAPDSFWPALRAATQAAGVYLIADEVMSAFGRCGEWFAWQRYGAEAQPDLMTLAKGLTGAHLPLGAVVVSAPVARALEPQMLLTGLTYCGHPLSCAAGVAAIESYAADDLIERSRRLGASLLGELQRMQARHRVIGEVRGGHGLFAVIELVRDRASREPLAPWPQLHAALRALLARALERGVSFAARGNLILIAPPLVIAEHELADALALLEELLADLATALESPA
ncbi:MAG TPA: aminotransferase class III-fold pyridoxal phosphate-dependent enzyme [Steroidobacteraceae bacterium]|jgi:taurine--2-oxoglutarate transaminase|nr:aminotransferase class III-fold pyridoxal phosphate-dependent enzyme [Steroidobacteraceae bacterium]